MRILWFGIFLVLGVLSGCGHDSGEHVVTGQDFMLSIDGPVMQSTADPVYLNQLDAEGRWYLEGDGFLPPGTTCAATTCTDALGYTSSAYMGPHTLVWENLTTGESGIISQGSRLDSSLSWPCYCDVPPRWSAYVPVLPGVNRIVVTESAGAVVQETEVFVMRE